MIRIGLALAALAFVVWGCGKAPEKIDLGTKPPPDQPDESEKLAASMERDEMAVRSLDELTRLRFNAGILANRAKLQVLVSRKCLNPEFGQDSPYMTVKTKGPGGDFCQWNAQGIGGQIKRSWTLAGSEDYYGPGGGDFAWHSVGKFELSSTSPEKPKRKLRFVYARATRLSDTAGVDGNFPFASDIVYSRIADGTQKRSQEAAKPVISLHATVVGSVHVYGTATDNAADIGLPKVEIEYTYQPVAKKGDSSTQLPDPYILRLKASTPVTFAAIGQCLRPQGDFQWSRLHGATVEAKGTVHADVNGIQFDDGGVAIAWPKDHCLEL